MHPAGAAQPADCPPARGADARLKRLVAVAARSMHAAAFLQQLPRAASAQNAAPAGHRLHLATVVTVTHIHLGQRVDELLERQGRPCAAVEPEKPHESGHLRVGVLVASHRRSLGPDVITNDIDEVCNIQRRVQRAGL